MKKRILILSLSAIALVFTLNSCYKDNAEDLYLTYPGNGSCDTTSVTYSKTIAPIFSANCNSCHGSGNSTGINTNTYDAVVANIGRIQSSVHHTGNYPMPKNSAPLSTCDLAKIDIWIRANTPNN